LPARSNVFDIETSSPINRAEITRSAIAPGLHFLSVFLGFLSPLVDHRDQGHHLVSLELGYLPRLDAEVVEEREPVLIGSVYDVSDGGGSAAVSSSMVGEVGGTATPVWYFESTG